MVGIELFSSENEHSPGSSSVGRELTFYILRKGHNYLPDYLVDIQKFFYLIYV